MPLPYSLFQPLRYTQKDKQYLEARKKEYSDYDAQADAYNKLVEAYNTGPQAEEFTAVAPVAPTATEADIQNYQKEAANRARSAAGQRQTAIIAAVNPEKYNLAGFAFADGGLVDVDSLSVASFAVGGTVGQMPAAEPIAFDGPLSMADGGLVDINSLSVAAFAKGGEAGEQYESLEDIMADAPSQDEEQKEWEQEIPVRDLTRQLNETVDKYRAGRASEADLRQFFPNYSDYDIANMFGMTDAGQSAPRAESLVQPFLNSQSYNRAVDRARMEDYQVERDIRQKSPNIYPYKRDFKLQLQELAEGGEVKEEAAYTEQEIDRMRAAMAQSQADKGSKSPTQQAVKRIIPKSTAQGPQQKSSLARQQLYALPPYPLDMTGKLGQAGPIKRADGSPEYGEIAEQMTVGTPLPTDQESPADTAANKMLRALSEGARGFVGAEALEPGSEAYRTGQALANMPAVGIVAGTAKGAGKAVSEVAKAKPKSLTKKDIREIASELETSRGQLAELVKKYPQIIDASVADVETLTKGEPFTAYRGISLLPGRELRREATPSMTMDPSVAMGILTGAPVMITKDGFIMPTPVLRQYPGMRPSETQVYVPSLIEQIIERQPGALEMRIPTRSGEKMTVADIFKEVKGEKELLADVSKKEPQDVLFNRYQGGVGDRYLMEVARKVLAGEWKGGESLAKEIGGYQPDPKALAQEFDEFAEMVKKRSAIKKAVGGEVSNEDFIQQTITGTPLPTDQGPSLASQGLNLLKQAGQTVYGNLREAVTDPVAFNKRALGNVAQQLQSDPQEFIMNWTGGGLGGIIRPKGGGNLLPRGVEEAIEPLLPTAGAQGKRPSELLKEMKKTYPPESLFRLSEETGQTVERSFQELERGVALEDWIKNKFGNYIKKQMGTEDDPIRKLADEMSAKVQADYQAGLKRIAKMKDDIAKAKAKGKGTEASEAALADEIEKVEEAFRSASILPAQMPPYTHVSSSLGKARKKAGFSPYEIAESNQGQSYEEMMDVAFIPKTAGEIRRNVSTPKPLWAQTSENVLEQNPWISKLGEEDIIYRLRSEDINERQIFTHAIDELRNALNPNSGLPPNLLLKPEDMQGLGIEKAFRHVNNINDWRAQQRVAANLEEAQRSATTIKEYPDTPKRLKWQQLKPAEYTELPPGYSVTSSYEGPALFGPDGKKLTTFSAESEIPVQQQALNFIAKNDLEKALQYEGSTMRHCVGGYCDSVYSGETNIFSLRDKKGEPHVTIETAPADIRRTGNTPRDFIDSLDGESYTNLLNRHGFKPDEMDTIFNLNNDLNMILANRKIISTPEFQEWLRNKPAEILQIKGKGNAKPNEEYIPFVQDFIKSQQWSHIGDLQNTDLVPLKLTMSRSLEKKGIDINVAFTDDNLQPYVTKQEFNRLADLVGGVNKYD